MNKIMTLLIVAVLVSAVHGVGADVQTIGKDELKQRLGTAELVILDVRKESDWESSELKITGAVRADPSDVQTWSQNLSRDKLYVLYCA